MYTKAMDKIRDEMAKNSGNPGIQFLGEWMTEQLESTPAIAEKVLQNGKTLAGAFGEIRKYAESHKSGSYAFVPPAKALELVSAYYGLDALPEKAETQAPAPVPQEPDDLDLDALLGGL